MKRKICIALLIAIVACFAVCLFSACGGSALKMNDKYILDIDVKENENEQVYFIFYSNGTGKYKYYYNHVSSIDSSYNYTNDYTITFKYTYADGDNSAVVCFYDSVEYGSNHTQNGSTVSTSWTRLLTVSDNVLCYASSSGYTYYINENYLKTIPNFGS